MAFVLSRTRDTDPDLRATDGGPLDVYTLRAPESEGSSIAFYPTEEEALGAADRHITRAAWEMLAGPNIPVVEAGQTPEGFHVRVLTPHVTNGAPDVIEL
jgi:hypothetical protein